MRECSRPKTKRSVFLVLFIPSRFLLVLSLLFTLLRLIGAFPLSNGLHIESHQNLNVCIGRHAKGIHNTLISLSPLSSWKNKQKTVGFIFLSFHEYQIYLFFCCRSIGIFFLSFKFHQTNWFLTHTKTKQQQCDDYLHLYNIYCLMCVTTKHWIVYTC